MREHAFTRKRLALLATLACLLAGCSASTTARRSPGMRPPEGAVPAGAAEAPLDVIDAHIHTNFDDLFYQAGNVMHSKAELAAEMKRYHVVGAVAMNHPGNAYADLSDLNVVQCVGLPATVDATKLEADLASGRFRCIKIYLGYEHQFASDPAYEPAYRLAEKYGVPVVFHTGDTGNPKAKLKYADPLTVDEVAVDHPRVTFVLAHAGNPWIESAAEVAYKNPNVVIDGSAFLIGDLKRSPPETIEAYVVRPLTWIFGYLNDPTKLMFGTDWPETEIGPYLEVFKRAIPKRHWQAVFHDNAARVYGFDTKAAVK